MSRLKFTPQMFFLQEQISFINYLAAIQAQMAFDRWLEEQRSVFTNNDGISWSGHLQESSTRSARLVDFKEINKAPCEHEPEHDNGYNYWFKMECKKCGKQIKATGWSEL